MWQSFLRFVGVDNSTPPMRAQSMRKNVIEPPLPLTSDQLLLVLVAKKFQHRCRYWSAHYRYMLAEKWIKSDYYRDRMVYFARNSYLIDDASKYGVYYGAVQHMNVMDQLRIQWLRNWFRENVWAELAAYVWHPSRMAKWAECDRDDLDADAAET